MQALERWEVLELFARDPVDRSRLGPGPARVDDDHAAGAAHLESDVHPGRPAVDEPDTVGKSRLPQVPDQDRPDAVVTAQQVPAADHQQLAGLALELGAWQCGHGFLLGWPERQTAPLMTNWFSSFPVLPS